MRAVKTKRRKVAQIRKTKRNLERGKVANMKHFWEMPERAEK